jgi:hypothetical protein
LDWLSAKSSQYTPIPGRRRQRQHGQLQEVGLVQTRIEQAEFVGMNQVLGVVQDDAGEFLAHALLFFLDGAADPIQAIGLGGGAVVRQAHQAQFGVARRRLADGGDGSRVVGIDADEDAVQGVAQRGQVVIEHRGDDVGLAPARNGDRDGPLGLRRPAFGRFAARQLLACQTDQPQQVDDQVIQRRDENVQSQRNQQPARQPGHRPRHFTRVNTCLQHRSTISAGTQAFLSR